MCFEFDKFPIITNTLDKVFSFFSDRSKWKELHSVQENLLKYNSEMRKNTEFSRKNTFNHANSIKSSIGSKSHTEPNCINAFEEKKKEYTKSTIRESDELKVNGA